MMISWLPGILYFAGIFKGIPLDIPTWGWVIIIFSGVIVAQSLAYRKLKNMFTKQVIEPNEIEEILSSLAALRTKGVELRNDGMALRSEQTVNEWKENAKTWREKVKSEIRKLSVAEANLFSTEDLVPVREFQSAVNPDHKLYVGILSKDTEKLRELVQRLSPQNLAKKSSISE